MTTICRLLARSEVPVREKVDPVSLCAWEAVLPIAELDEARCNFEGVEEQHMELGQGLVEQINPSRPGSAWINLLLS